MSRLTRDGIVEPVSRDQILRRERGHREMPIFSVQLITNRIGNLTPSILTLAIYLYVCINRSSISAALMFAGPP